MNFIIQWAINTVLKWAYSLKPEDFATAFKFVLEAQSKFSAGADKQKWVRDQLATVLGSSKTARAINFLIELAVAKLGNK